MFIRVKDKDTGHEFDVPEEDKRIKVGSLVHVKPVRYPATDRPRQPKHNIQPAREPKEEDS